MVFFVVLLYLAIACAIVWLFAFSDGRRTVFRLVTAFGVGTVARIGALKCRQGKALVSLSGRTVTSIEDARATFSKHAVMLWTGLFALCAPPMTAWLFSNWLELDSFDDTEMRNNTHAAELLKGEHLIAPQALPPDVFATQEVTRIRPLLSSASRNWELLNEDFSRRLLTVFKIMREQHGYELAIIEGYRSPERQSMLASMGSHVTNAAAFQSYHQFGLASDCAFLRDGKLVISEKDPWAMRGYQLFGEAAESVGLTWGGRWKMMDFGHVELRVPGLLKKASPSPSPSPSAASTAFLLSNGS